jgi:hypothetical protein
MGRFRARVATSLVAAGGAFAQVSRDLDDPVRSLTDRRREAGATVVARDVASGFTTRATANANGGYVLPGSRPIIP